MKNNKFKAFILFLNDNNEDKLKNVDNDAYHYFHLTPDFNLSINPAEVKVDTAYRTKRCGQPVISGIVVSSGSELTLRNHIEFIKKVVYRHNGYPRIPNAVILAQVSKKEIYSKIPGAVDIKFTDEYHPIPLIVYDDGTTQALDCERLEKLTKIEHVVACVDTTYNHSNNTNIVHNEMFFASQGGK